MVLVNCHTLRSLAFLFVMVISLFDQDSRLFGQNIPGQFEAIAGTPYGVARLMIPAGQVESTASLRIVVSDVDGRVMFPAVDLLTSDPPEVNTGRQVDRPIIGNGALIQRIRSAIQNAREQIDPPEIIRVQFLFRGSEPFQVRISGDLSTTVDVKNKQA